MAVRHTPTVEGPAAPGSGCSDVGLRLSAQVAARGLDVTLEVGDHERLAVLGPNGAGKSTLLAVLAGTLRPGDLLVTLGAGSVTTVGPLVLDLLRHR